MSNAVKAKAWASGFSLAYTTTGAPPVIMWHACAAAVKRGDAVILNNLKVQIALATSGTLYGVALASGAVDDVIPIAVGDRNNVFVGQADDKTEIITAFPHECDIIGATGVMKLDIGASVEDVAHCLGYVPGDDKADATVPGRVYFQIKRSSFDELVAAR